MYWVTIAVAVSIVVVNILIDRREVIRTDVVVVVEAIAIATMIMGLIEIISEAMVVEKKRKRAQQRPFAVACFNMRSLACSFPSHARATQGAAAQTMCSLTLCRYTYKSNHESSSSPLTQSSFCQGMQAHMGVMAGSQGGNGGSEGGNGGSDDR